MHDEPTDAALPYEEWTSFGEIISRKRRALGLTQAGLAMAQFFSGRAEAVQDLENVVEQMHLYENEVGAANANHMLGRCYLQLGAFERAELHLDAAIEYYRRTQMNPFLARAWMSRAELMEKRKSLAT